MKIEECHIRQQVRVPSGYEAEIVEIAKDGWCRVDFGPNMAHYMPVRAGHLEPVSDPCEGCQKLASIDKCCEYWKAACEEARRNATYWREELEKLQNEALAECKPLSEGAKCYIQVAPEKLLMSQEARRVIEYLDIRNGPMDLRGIFEDCDLGQGKLLDALAEASDAGKIRLVNGKYEIVRD
jgi:hypothetical protein